MRVSAPVAALRSNWLYRHIHRHTHKRRKKTLALSSHFLFPTRCIGCISNRNDSPRKRKKERDWVTKTKYIIPPHKRFRGVRKKCSKDRSSHNGLLYSIHTYIHVHCTIYTVGTSHIRFWEREKYTRTAVYIVSSVLRIIYIYRSESVILLKIAAGVARATRR